MEAKEKHDILLIGSSHMLWDIDRDQLEKSIGKKVGVLNIPGANMEMRYEFINDYLNRFSNDLPKLILLETDKYSFHPKRYPGDTYKAILGYYHKGLFQPYLRRKVYETDGAFVSLAFLMVKIYSYNHFFHYIGGRFYDRYISNILPVAFSWFSSDLYAEDSKDELTTEDQKKIKNWVRLYEELGNSIDPKSKEYFDKITEITKMHNIRLILLDTPNYSFDDETDFDPIRKVFKNSESDKITYLRLSPEKYEKNLKYLHDASHLNLFGRMAYTKELSEYLREK
jgi:hypothetical protein